MNPKKHADAIDGPVTIQAEEGKTFTLCWYKKRLEHILLETLEKVSGKK